MKKEEKTKITKERILSAAIAEFGSKNYDAASINNICQTGQIPKGLLYHNFNGKDDLYLLCVKECYDKLTAFLKSQSLQSSDVKEALQNTLMARQHFFEQNPLYANIFFNTILQPPEHLSQQLGQLRSEFDQYSAQCYLAVLQNLNLRNGITKNIALEYFLATSEMFNRYFQKKAKQGASYQKLVQNHEDMLPAQFDIMLYGIAKSPAE